MNSNTQTEIVPNRSGRSRRGFASMDPERRREIARKGGRASHGGRGSSYTAQSTASKSPRAESDVIELPPPARIDSDRFLTFQNQN